MLFGVRGLENGGDGISRELARDRVDFGSLEMVVRGGACGRSRKVAEAHEIAISMNGEREFERTREKLWSFVTRGLDRARGEIWGRYRGI